MTWYDDERRHREQVEALREAGRRAGGGGNSNADGCGCLLGIVFLWCGGWGFAKGVPAAFDTYNATNGDMFQATISFVGGFLMGVLISIAAPIMWLLDWLNQSPAS